MAEHTFERLARSSPAELESVLRFGAAPDVASLTGAEWRGFNVGLKMRLIGSQKFVKGFFAGTDGVEGYNTPVRQNGLDAPWVAKPSPEDPKRFGFFIVQPVEPGGADSRYPQRSPTRRIRDYLVQPDPGNPRLMLGKGYLAVSGARLFPQFFVIERLDRLAWRP